MLPGAAGAVVGGEGVVLLEGMETAILLGEHQAVVVARTGHDDACEGRVGLCGVDGIAALLEGVAEGLEGEGHGEATIREVFLFAVAGTECCDGHEG